MRRPVSWSARALLCACGVVLSSVRIEPVRWWRSPSVVSALQVTPQQTSAIEHVYQASLQAASATSERIMGTTAQIVTRLREGKYDEELLNLTGQLVEVRREQCERRRDMLKLSSAQLSVPQRQALLKLIRAGGIME